MNPYIGVLTITCLAACLAMGGLAATTRARANKKLQKMCIQLCGMFLFLAVILQIGSMANDINKEMDEILDRTTHVERGISGIENSMDALEASEKALTKELWKIAAEQGKVLDERLVAWTEEDENGNTYRMAGVAKLIDIDDDGLCEFEIIFFGPEQKPMFFRPCNEFGQPEG